MSSAGTELQLENCRPVSGREQALDRYAASALLADLPGWTIQEGEILQKQFSFTRYAAGVLFVNALAALAERENHHPDIELGYGRVTVKYRTHDVDGLSRNDFICAAKAEALSKI